jgi:lipopolysaccharide transport system permease protein
VVIAIYKASGAKIDLSPRIFLLPILLVEMALLALGLGCLIASATVKYRDLNIVVGYTLQLWMYGSLVIYPRPSVPDNLQGLLLLNPMASLIEWYRSSLFGTEHAPIRPALVAAGMIVVILLAGLWRFTRAEGTFTDSI